MKLDTPSAHPAAALSTPGGHNNNFNALRLIMAAMVLLAHSAELVDGNPRRELFFRIFGTDTVGGLAVAGFFLLSGYLIVKSWDRRPQLAEFLISRTLRIYPAFIVASLVSVLFVPLFVADLPTYYHAVRPVMTIKAMLLLNIPQPPDFFRGPYPLANGAMWSIGYEFRCYLLVAVLGVFGCLRRRRVWAGLAGLTIVGMLLPAVVSRLTTRLPSVVLHDPNVFVHWASYFFVGSLYYLFGDRIRLRGDVAAIALVPLVLSFRSAHTIDIGLLTAGAYGLFWLSFARIPLLEPLKALPDISYGLYLYGWPVQKLIIQYAPGISPWVLFPLALAVSAGCGWLSWVFIEQGFIRLKPGKRPARVPTHPVLVPAALDLSAAVA